MNTTTINNSVYYFILDNSVQWFRHIVEIENKDVQTMIKVPNGVSSDFITNILNREIHFGNRLIMGEWYSGWSISKYEFEKLKEIINLYPSYEKYLKLCSLPRIDI
jgi:hypothetical protein